MGELSVELVQQGFKSNGQTSQIGDADAAAAVDRVCYYCDVVFWEKGK